MREKGGSIVRRWLRVDSRYHRSCSWATYGLDVFALYSYENYFSALIYELFEQDWWAGSGTSTGSFPMQLDSSCKISCVVTIV
jgi:hypothetical protein